MAPKRSREVTTEVSPARPRSKPRVSQFLSITVALELLSSKASFRRYSEFFHGRDLVAGGRFNLPTLTATGLQFEEKLTQCGLRSLTIIEQDVFPEWVWQFYSNAQFKEDLLVTRVQGQEVSFSVSLNITVAPELFSSKVSFRRYSEFFHGRDLVAGRRFNLSTLTAAGLQFEEKLTHCGLRSLATIE